MGHPTNYKSIDLAWEGRKLASYGSNISFDYDENGIRTRKTVGTTVTDYYYNGSLLMGMTQGSNVFLFSYDASGSVVSVNFNGTEYYYLKNAQSDIVGIVDGSGNIVVKYTYDAWGKLLSMTQPTVPMLAGYNPFRYRGYVYDVETGLYYLQSRYYDPSVGRFISPDVFVSTGQGILGNNMYAYCGNNPACRGDSTGRFWNEILEFTKTALYEIGKAIGAMAPAYAGCGGAALSDGPLPFGDMVALTCAALLTAGAVGYGIYQATQASSTAIPKVDANNATTTQSSPTVIYRYGGTNPGNLTPSQKDVDLFPITGKGLSFSTIPKPGAAMTTIEALNATGVVYAVQDGAGHVSVFPIGGTLEDWHNAGASSVWTIAVKSVVVKWDRSEQRE